MRFLLRVILMRFELDNRGQAYDSAQFVLKYYQDRGMLPNVTVFNSSSPDVLRLLFEFRLPESQVTSCYLNSICQLSASCAVHSPRCRLQQFYLPLHLSNLDISKHTPLRRKD